MLNKVFLQGRLVADPELRHTQQGTPVASYRLAVDRGYKSKDPNAQNADFINVVSWRNTAEFVSRYFTKGRMMLVEGRLQMRDYTDRDGNRRVAAEVVTDNVFFCDSPRRDGQPSGGAPPPRRPVPARAAPPPRQTASPAAEIPAAPPAGGGRTGRRHSPGSTAPP